MRFLSDRTVAHLKHVAEWPDLAETKYALLEEIGRGGMGTVYLAEDRVLGRRVALKVVSTGASDPAAAARMLREARVIARLEHPGIVPVHDAGTLPDGRMFYAMKRVDGRRLDEVVFGDSTTLPDRLRVFQKICDAVAFAHAHGVIHRDLKPENVMVGPFGEVLVMDWGIAKLHEESGARPAASSPANPSNPSNPSNPAPAAATTADGTVLGTPAYMAPEQAAGRAEKVGTAADVYALGAILRFLLTGRAPFDQDAAQRRARGEATLAPDALESDGGLPASLAAVAAKAMALDPAERYASVETLSAEVERYLDGARVLAHQESLGEKSARLFGRYRTPILLIAAYLLMRTILFFYARGG
jgi:eukaryotic-like serine/threonine-protein kinase